MSCCNKCNRTFGSTADVIMCNGFCNGYFHNEKECTGIDKPVAAACKKHKNIWFFCDSCSILMNNNFFKKVLGKDDNICRDQVNDLNKISEEIANNRKLIEDLQKSISSLQKPKPTLPVWRPIGTPVTSAKRRAVDDASDAHVTVLSNASGVRGTKLMSVNAKIIQPKFWIHISEFETSETEDAVKLLVSDCLNTDVDKLEAFKLVPKDRDINTLRFISFKVGIPLELKDVALSSSTWPIGLSVRQFDSSRRPNFRSRIGVNPRKDQTPSTYPGSSNTIQQSQSSNMQITPADVV